MKKKLVLLFSFVFVIAAALGIMSACSNTKVTVEMAQTEASVNVGKTVTLVATASDGSQLTWASDNEDVATVTKQGRVSGIKVGTAVITATSGDASASCTVTVKEAVQFTFKDADGNTLTEATVDRDGTLQLTATASDGSAITAWSSSDAEIATVSNTGLVSGIFDGDATITARTANDSGTIKVTVVDKATDKYFLSTEQAADKWFYYINTDGGRNTELNRAEFRNGAVTFDFSGNGNWYYTDIQLGIKNSSVAEGWHKVTAKINSDFAGAVTIMDTVVNLKEGDNTVSVCYEQKEGAVSFHIYFAASEFINDGKVVISEIDWADFTPVTLQTPSFTLGQDNNVAITDESNTEGVKEYQVGLFPEDGEAPVFARQFSAEGGLFDITECEENGEYIVRIRAIGNPGFTSSAWSTDNSVKLTVNNSGISYDLASSGESGAVASGKWTCWAGDGGSITSATYVDGVVTVKGINSNWAFYGVQIFRDYSQFVVGDTIHVSMKINTNAAGGITISGMVVNLVAGDNDVHLYITRGSSGSAISMQLGVNGADAATWLTPVEGESFELKISEVKLEKYTPVKLAAPTLAIANNGVITVTDTENTAANVGGYEVVFYQGDVKKATIKVVSGEEMDVSKIANGNYTVKIKAVAVANSPYIDSEVSAEGVSYTVANAGGVQYDLNTVFGAGEAAASAGTWGVWGDQNWCGSNVTISSATYDNGTVSVAFTSTGTCAFGLQFNYVNPDYVAGTTYSFDIVASVDMDIQVESGEATVIHLTAGEKVHLTGAADASFYVQINIKDNVGGTVTITDVVWAE